MHSLIDGQSIILGRKTWEEVPHNWDCNYFVVSPTLAARGQGEYSFKLAVEESWKRNPECSIYALGGVRIFQEAFRFATKLYITRVQREYYGDTYFPAIPSYYRLAKSQRVSDLLVFEEYDNAYLGGYPVPIEVL